MKKIYYKVDDECETPLIYEDIDMALETIKDLLEGMGKGGKVTITAVEMTPKEFNNLLEL